MKIINKAKLVALIPLVILALGCESTEVKPTQTEKVEVEQKTKEQSILRQQIQLMLEGKDHSEAILKAEVGKQEWKVTFFTLKEELAKHTSQHGKRPSNKDIAYTHAVLKRIKAEWRLKRADQVNKEALESLENTIKQAVENERKKKASR